MQFKEGADVVTANGDKVGDIDRIVIDPRTQKVTHIVVREGFIFTEDKVVPTPLVATTTEDEVVLRDDIDDLDALPTFEKQHYVNLSDTERERFISEAETTGTVRPLYWYPAYGSAMMYPGYPTEVEYAAEIERNIPEDTIALEEDAEVVTADDRHVGRVERVMTNEQERVSHFLISEGVVFTHKKLVPAAWIDTVTEDTVRLAVGSDMLENLPDYQE